MAVVTAMESRTEQRDVYVPPHERGMAHRSFLSPDRKSVLIVEMDNGGWLPCRLLPFDGSSRGRQVGPAGQCTFAAWSPDGHGMYFIATVGGASHIWRQPFPSGEPEQITFGPTQEAGLWIPADGRSLLTSVGISDSRVWVHDEQGDRQIAAEGAAYLPSGSRQAGRVFSPDGRKLYFLVQRQTVADSGPELWVADLASGAVERLLPGIRVTSYDVLPDGRRVAFVTRNTSGSSRLWIAALDRHSPPRELSTLEADNPCGVDDGTLFFRVNEGQANFLYRMQGGNVPQKAYSQPILALRSCSPDGQWVLAGVASAAEDRTTTHVFLSMRGMPAVPLCDACDAMWSRDGKYLFVAVGAFGSMRSERKTYALKLRPGMMFPDVPPGGITPENITSLPVAKVFIQALMYPASDLSSYAYFRETAQRNIFRLPLP